MAHFCKNCGTSLREGARFCPVCGTAAVPPKQQNVKQPSKRPVQQPGQMAQQPSQRPAQQPRQAAQQPAQRPVQPSKQQKVNQQKRPQKTNPGKTKRFPLVPVIIGAAAVALVAVFLITALWAPGFLIDHSADKKNINVSDKNLSAMLDYAERLEANGNHEAAAQIYAMVPDAANDAAKEEADKIIDNTPEKQIMDGLGEAREIINDVESLKEE